MRQAAEGPNNLLTPEGAQAPKGPDALEIYLRTLRTVASELQRRSHTVEQNYKKALGEATCMYHRAQQHSHNAYAAYIASMQSATPSVGSETRTLPMNAYDTYARRIEEVSVLQQESQRRSEQAHEHHQQALRALWDPASPDGAYALYERASRTYLQALQRGIAELHPDTSDWQAIAALAGALLALATQAGAMAPPSGSSCG